MQTPQAIELPKLPEFLNGSTENLRRDFTNYGLACYKAGRAAASGQAGWQPIETAPTVGNILLWWKNGGAVTGGFAIDEEWTRRSKTPREGWKGDGDEGIPRNQEDCTHWQLLRAPAGCQWPRFSDGHSTQEWLENRASPSALVASPVEVQAAPFDETAERAAFKAWFDGPEEITVRTDDMRSDWQCAAFIGWLGRASLAASPAVAGEAKAQP